MREAWGYQPLGFEVVGFRAGKFSLGFGLRFHLGGLRLSKLCVLKALQATKRDLATSELKGQQKDLHPKFKSLRLKPPTP